MRYYYTNAQNLPNGPAELEEILRLQQSGQLPAFTQVCEEGGQTWKPLSSLTGAAPVAPQPAPAAAPGGPSASAPGPSSFGQAASLLSPLLNWLLNGVRGLLGPGRLAGFFARCESLGHLLMLAGAALTVLVAIVLSVRQNNFLLLAAAFGGVLFLLVLQFAAQRFLAACAALVRNTPSQIGSTAVLDCLGLLLLVGAVLQLLFGLVGAAVSSALSVFAGGVFTSALMFLGAAICLSPSIAGVAQRESSAGEEAIGLTSFFLKTGLVLLPITYLLCALIGCVLIIAGLFTTSLPYSLPYAVQSLPGVGYFMQGLLGLGVLLCGPIAVIASYFFFLLSYLWLDVFRAVLCLPGKLDHLKS